MKIVHAYPPNMIEIKAKFPTADRAGVMFCYGKKIYVPDGTDVPESLIAHEEVHSERQGWSPASWWEKYLEDAKFRYNEELLAHIAEFEWYRNQSRKTRQLALKVIAKRLASPLYGRMVSLEKAKASIKEGVKPRVKI